MIFLSIPLIAILLVLINFTTESHSASLWAVEAGTVTGPATVNIGELKKYVSSTVHICPENYSSGFSIECRGTDVKPDGVGVWFFVNDTFVKKEWGSPYYMIAGKRTRSATRPTFIAPWKFWANRLNGCHKRYRNCVLKIMCTHAGGEIEKYLVIKKYGQGCSKAADSVPTFPLLGRVYNCHGATMKFTSKTTAKLLDAGRTAVYEFKYDETTLTTVGETGVPGAYSSSCAPGGPLNTTEHGTLTLTFRKDFTGATSGVYAHCDGGSQPITCREVYP